MGVVKYKSEHGHLYVQSVLLSPFQNPVHVVYNQAHGGRGGRGGSDLEKVLEYRHEVLHTSYLRPGPALTHKFHV